MGRATLSYSAFRDNLPARPPVPNGLLQHLGQDGPLQPPSLTRREMVAISGTIAAGMSASLNAAACTLIPAVVAQNRHSISISAGGRSFVLDARSFGGTRRRLVVKQSAEELTASLIGARYPGTDVPFDFSFRFAPLSGNTRVTIESSSLGFAAAVPLIAWLEGRRDAHDSVVLRDLATKLDKTGVVRFSGRAKATLRPDFTLDLSGRSIAGIEGSGVAAAADEAHLWLASRWSRTSLTRRIKLRTYIQLVRGSCAEWSVEGIATAAGNGVEFDGGSFDQATVEAAETSAGNRVTVVALENRRGAGDARLRFPIAGVDVASALPLGNPRFGFVFGDGARFSLVADVQDASTWLHLSKHSVLVGKHPSSSTAEITGANRTADRVRLKTELLAIAVPMEGVISSPITFPKTRALANKGATMTKPPRVRTYVPESVQAMAPVGYVPDAGAVTVIRPDDMLMLRFEFYNLKLVIGTGAVLKRKSLSSPAYLVVQMPPQALLEQAYYAEPGTFQLLAWLNNQKAPPIQARLAGPTRLAFAIPNADADTGIPYTLDALLDWFKYGQSVAPYARDVPPHASATVIYPRAPLKGSHYPLVPPETSIEAPWGLFLSPSEHREYWEHRITPHTYNGVTTLWHTTLTGRPRTLNGLTINPPAGVRVVWARGYRNKEPAPDLNFRNSFTTSADDLPGQQNRWALVDITAWHQHARVSAKRLTLSPLGAWLDLKGQWPTDEYMVTEQIASPLLAWEHRATMGRDQYVRIVIAGRIFPFGHKASLITITERKFENAPDGKRTAYLKQRSFIFIREPERTFEYGNTARNRATPFRRVVFKTRVTPDLMSNASTLVQDPTSANKTTNAFWPHTLSTGAFFNFEYRVTDWDGRVSEVSSPLIFIEEDWAVRGAENPEGEFVTREINICDRAMRDVVIPMESQKVAFAEPLPASAATDRRVLQTSAIRLGAENVVSASWSKPGNVFFHPQLHRAQVRLEDVEALMGTDAGTWIKLWKGYVDCGYGTNGLPATDPNSVNNTGGRVFAEIADDGSLSVPPVPGALGLNIPPERTRGFASPNVAVRGLSATEGAFGGTPTKFGTGNVEASDFFDQVNPKLFGDVRLLDILEGVILGTGSDVPKFTDQIVERDGQSFARYDYNWVTDKFGDSGFLVPGTNPKAQITLNAYLEKNLSDIAAAPMAGVHGNLTNFTLVFPPGSEKIIEVQFNYFTFDADASGNVDVDPSIEDIRFAGALEFVNQLRDLMNFTGDDGSGFALDVTGSGVSAIVTIALPDIAVGIFSLKNMAITAGIKIPFTGEPVRFPFSFCTQEKPFELAVSGFGGGGYFLVELQASDEYPVALVEFSLEFGVCASISLCGIASGSVEIKGGVLMRFEMGGLTFTSFFHMAGKLDILGLIVVSITFHLELTYMNKQAAGGPTAILIGEATLTIDIEILFFSFSVDLTLSKQFEGDDPRFGDWMNQGEWATYCGAFGPATVGV